MPRQRKSTIHSDDWYEPKIQDRKQKKKKNQARKDLQKQKFSEKELFFHKTIDKIL